MGEREREMSCYWKEGAEWDRGTKTGFSLIITYCYVEDGVYINMLL